MGTLTDKIKETDRKVKELRVDAAVRQDSDMAAAICVASTVKVSEANSNGKLIEEMKLAFAVKIFQTESTCLNSLLFQKNEI